MSSFSPQNFFKTRRFLENCLTRTTTKSFLRPLHFVTRGQKSGDNNQLTKISYCNKVLTKQITYPSGAVTCAESWEMVWKKNQSFYITYQSKKFYSTFVRYPTLTLYSLYVNKFLWGYLRHFLCGNSKDIGKINLENSSNGFLVVNNDWFGQITRLTAKLYNQ